MESMPNSLRVGGDRAGERNKRMSVHSKEYMCARDGCKSHFHLISANLRHRIQALPVPATRSGTSAGGAIRKATVGSFCFPFLVRLQMFHRKNIFSGSKIPTIHRPFVQNSMLFCSGSNQASVGRRQVHTRVAQSASYSKYSSTTQTQDTHSVAETNCACSRLGWTYMLP